MERVLNKNDYYYEEERYLALCKIEELIDTCPTKDLRNEIKKILIGVLS